MSVIVKGSIMPLMCEECPCYDCDDYSCKATGRGVIEYRYDGRPDNCPLVEIPTPHGRLIDADRFLEWLKEFHPNDVVIMSGVKNARTVIEAEVSE